MILEQHYLGCLAHASYLIADERTGVAVVVDPQRECQHPLGRLRDLLGELPADRRTVALCASGYRASIAASLLQRERREVTELAGGPGAWSATATA